MHKSNKKKIDSIIISFKCGRAKNGEKQKFIRISEVFAEVYIFMFTKPTLRHSA